MEENKLIRYEGGLIRHVENAISITNKLLAIPTPELIPYRKKDKWGFCTPNKNIVIDCVYDEADRFIGNFAIVILQGKYGIISKYGKEIVPCKYDYIYDFREGVALARLNGKYGFIDITGDEIIPCTFKEAYNFHEGLALIFSEDDKCSFINKRGNLITPFIFDNAKSFSDELAVTYSTKNGYQYINKDGYVVASNKQWSKAASFSEGLAIIQTNGQPHHGNYSHYGNYGFIDKNYSQVIPCLYYDCIPFSEGLAMVRPSERSLYCFIDKRGTEVLPSEYKRPWIENHIGFVPKFGRIFQKHINTMNDNDKSTQCYKNGEFSEDRVVVGSYSPNKRFQYGFIDKQGNYITECIYDSANSFEEGLAKVSLNKKSGFINRSGETLIPFIYDLATSFSQGVAMVILKASENKSGFIDKNGNEYWQD